MLRNTPARLSLKQQKNLWFDLSTKKGLLKRISVEKPGWHSASTAKWFFDVHDISKYPKVRSTQYVQLPGWGWQHFPVFSLVDAHLIATMLPGPGQRYKLYMCFGYFQIMKIFDLRLPK